jgi:hypothetical protein
VGALHAHFAFNCEKINLYFRYKMNPSSTLYPNLNEYKNNPIPHTTSDTTPIAPLYSNLYQNQPNVYPLATAPIVHYSNALSHVPQYYSTPAHLPEYSTTVAPNFYDSSTESYFNHIVFLTNPVPINLKRKKRMKKRKLFLTRNHCRKNGEL